MVTKVTIEKNNRGNESINTIMTCMKEKFGELDGSEAINRRYASLLLRKAKGNLPSCLLLIQAAATDPWWGGRIHKVATIYYNMQAIIGSARKGQERIITIS